MATEGPAKEVAGRTNREVGFLVAALVALRVVLLLAAFSALPPRNAATSAVGNDATRFHQIASTPGRPYRDFQVEFPPISVGLIEVLGHGDSKGTAIRLGWLGLVLDVSVAGMLLLGWGEGVAVRYLVLGTPMVFFLYLRLDLLSIALAVAGLLLVKRGKQAWGGVALAAGVFVKLWPIVLLPLLVFRKQWRALAWAVGGTAVGTASWVWWGGAGAPMQVLTYRHAAGWEVESLIGSVMWVLTGQHARMRQGDLRIGSIPGWAHLGLLVTSVVGIGFAWAFVRRVRRPEGLGGVASVGSLLCCATLLAPQFMSWLLSWAAMSEESQIHSVMIALSAATTAVILATAISGAGGRTIDLALLFVRNALLLALTIIAFTSIRKGKEREPSSESVSGAAGE